MLQSVPNPSKGLITKRKKKKTDRLTKRRYIGAYLFILPQVIVFFGLSLYPIVMSYVYSFFQWNGIGPLNDFVGIGNYIELFQAPQFWADFGHSLEYTIGFTIISVGSGLILALILNDPRFKGKAIYRTAYFLPVVTTSAVIGVVMHDIFNIRGFVNQVLEFFGLTNAPIQFLLVTTMAMWILILVGSWKHVGITMIYWLTGLQTIPQDLYEAARIDGAGYWTTMRYVTLPLLKPVGATILLLTVVSSMQVFDLVKTLTGGDPYHSTETIELYIYRYAFGSATSGSRVGYASAAGVALGLFVFLVSAIFGLIGLINNKRAQKRRGGESINDYK